MAGETCRPADFEFGIVVLEKQIAIVFDSCDSSAILAPGLFASCVHLDIVNLEENLVKSRKVDYLYELSCFSEALGLLR